LGRQGRGNPGFAGGERLDEAGHQQALAPRLVAQGKVGVTVELGLAVVGHHQAEAIAFLQGLVDLPAQGRQLRGDIRAQDEDQIGLGQVRQFAQERLKAADAGFGAQGEGRLIGRRAAGGAFHPLNLGMAEDLGQALQGSQIGKAGRVVQLVGAQAAAEKFLKEIIGFVSGPGRPHPVDGLGAVSLHDLLKFSGHQVKRLIPGGFPEFALFLDERGFEAVRGFHHRPAETAPAAEQHGVFVPGP
jgi:hypothetical protein